VAAVAQRPRDSPRCLRISGSTFIADPMTVAGLIIGIFTGALGVGYIMYGRRQAKFAPLFSGIALCGYSYFVDGWIWLLMIGIALAVVPFVVDF
jgi:hypothetical protein